MNFEDMVAFDPVAGSRIIAIKYKLEDKDNALWTWQVGKRVGPKRQLITNIVRNDFSFYSFGILSYIIYVDDKPWKEVVSKEVELTFDTNE